MNILDSCWEQAWFETFADWDSIAGLTAPQVLDKVSLRAEELAYDHFQHRRKHAV